MGYDPDGRWNWSNFWGWVAVGALLAVGVSLIFSTVGLMSAGIIASGGLVANILVGSGVGVVAGVTSSIAIQSETQKIINPWSAFWSGIIGGGIGALSGATSYAFAQIGQNIGSTIGNYLANARHVGSGIKIAKVFPFQDRMIIAVPRRRQAHIKRRRRSRTGEGRISKREPGDAYLEKFPKLRKWFVERRCCHRRGHAVNIPDKLSAHAGSLAAYTKKYFSRLEINQMGLCKVCEKILQQ